MQGCAPTRGLIEEGVRELGCRGSASESTVWFLLSMNQTQRLVCFPSGVHVSLLQSVKQSQFLHDRDGWVLLDTDSGFQSATVCLSPAHILTVCFGSSG